MKILKYTLIFGFIYGHKVLFILLIIDCVMGEYSTNIGVKNGLYKDLKERKSPGQSFSGVIKELLIKAEKYEEMKDRNDINETKN